MKKTLILGIVIVLSMFIASCNPSHICGDGYCSSEEELIGLCPIDCESGCSICDKDYAIKDTLRDGETKTYTVDNEPYEITLIFVDNEKPSAKFTINGMPTNELKECRMEDVSEKLEIRVSEIMVNGRESMVEFCGIKLKQIIPSCPSIEEFNCLATMRSEKYYDENGCERWRCVPLPLDPVICLDNQMRDCKEGTEAESYLDNNGCSQWRCMPNAEATCHDDDSGFEPNIASRIYGINLEGEEFRFYDTCEDETTLIERVCETKIGGMVRFNCPNGCSLGRCNQ